MDSPVLVDTSVWIEYFRKKNPVFNQINELAENQQLGSLNLIVAELIQGARGQGEIEVIDSLAEVATILPNRRMPGKKRESYRLISGDRAKRSAWPIAT